MVLRKLGEKVAFFLTRKRLVGKDTFGNKYFVKHEVDMDGALVEKRLVKYPRGGAFQYDPTKISPEWHQWLSHTREEVPEEEPPRSREPESTRLPRTGSMKDTIKTPIGSIEQ